MYDLEETLTDSMINTKERGVMHARGMLGRSSTLTLNFFSSSRSRYIALHGAYI